MKRLLVASIAMLLGAVVSQAGTVTYNVNRTIGVGSVTGTIQTDGTFGTLDAGNITDWNLVLNDGSNIYDLTGPLSGNDSGVVVSGTDVSATATQLLFNFSGTAGALLFQADSPGLFSGFHYYCDSTSAGACFAGESDVPLSVFTSGFINIPQAGNQVIGSTGSATVPEPGTYGLILTGLALLGSFRFNLKKQ